MTTFKLTDILQPIGTSGYSGIDPITAAIVFGSDEIPDTIVHDDTTTNTTLYPSMASHIAGPLTVSYVSSTKLYFNPSTGNLSATIFNTLSDATQKSNIKVIQNAMSVVNQLDGVEFTLNSTGLKSSGVTAQQIESVVPHLVTSGPIKSVNYDGLAGYLIEGQKEMFREIASLKKEINTLTGKLNES